MKRLVLPMLLFLAATSETFSQVTQINNNNSLHTIWPLDNNRTICVSDIDSSIWITNATLAGTVQISPVRFEETLGTLSAGTLIFVGSTDATGSEIYITNGTTAGTVLVRDINAGPTGSDPTDMAVLNGFIYFTAETPAEGRELWRTNGTLAGTTRVKDIIAGPASSNQANDYHLFSNGSFLLFSAATPGNGIELYRSNGTDAGTVLLKDINTGNAGVDSSSPRNFYTVNNTIIFLARTTATGEELWRTDGTEAGTIPLADINPGPASFSEISIPVPPPFPPQSIPLFLGFHTFNNRAYFIADNGTSTGVMWVTDGTAANTDPVFNILDGTSVPPILLIDAVNYPNKFFFPVSDGQTRSEIWESDGTSANTRLFRSFTPTTAGNLPFILVPYTYDLLNQNVYQTLFQGNKFFFSAGSATEGDELWISDGTTAGTNRVKDIYAGIGNGIDLGEGSYLYTSNTLFFSGTTAAQGQELHRSDGTLAGTNIVQDIYLNAPGSEPKLSFISNNGRIIFSATDGNDPDNTDLFVVDGSFTPLPVQLTDFTVTLKSPDAHLQWHTAQEINSKDFTIQRSRDGVNFSDIGTVAASGQSSVKKSYSFIDAGIAHSGSGTVYYRLRSSDIDGKSTISQIITIKLNSVDAWAVRLLSNPVMGNVRILLSDVKESVQLSIHDLNGKKIYSESRSALNGQVSLAADNLPRGTYLLVAVSGGERKTLQFVK